MCENCCPRYAKYVVYFVIFRDLVGGISYLLYGLSRMKVDPVDEIFHPHQKYIAAATIPFAVVSLVMGTLLLVGVRQSNDQYVFIHVVMNSTILTHLSIYVIVVTEITELDVGTIFGYMILLIILWGIEYIVYMFYKEMKKVNITTVYAGDTTITYNPKSESDFVTGTAPAAFDNTIV